MLIDINIIQSGSEIEQVIFGIDKIIAMKILHYVCCKLKINNVLFKNEILDSKKSDSWVFPPAEFKITKIRSHFGNTVTFYILFNTVSYFPYFCEVCTLFIKIQGCSFHDSLRLLFCEINDVGSRIFIAFLVRNENYHIWGTPCVLIIF